MTHRSLSPFVMLAAAFAIVGCGGGDDGSPDAATGTGPRTGAISFVIDRDTQDVRNVYTINADGSDLRLLVRNAEASYNSLDGQASAWSDDGRVLAYSDDSCGVSVFDVVEKRTRQVVSDDLTVYCPERVALSPDGEHVAFEGIGGIWKMPVDGGTPRQLTFVREHDEPRWSPDGRHIAFLNGLRRNKTIAIVESNGGTVREVAVPGLDVSQEFEWSPDSRRIALGGGYDIPHIRILDIDSGRITTVAPKLWDGGYARPVWSPDATRLALLGNRQGQHEAPDGTYVIQLASGVLRRVISAGDVAYATQVSWSPDSSRLAVPVNDELWVVRTDGTGRKRLLAAGSSSKIEDVQWHPTGWRSEALGGTPASTRAPVVRVNHLGDTYDACGIELWRATSSRWLVAGEGNTGRGYAKPLRPGVWQILGGNRDVLGKAVATNAKRTRWNITDSRGTLVGIASGADGPWIALVLLWGGAECLE